MTIGIAEIVPTELYASAIARDWERIIMLASGNAPLTGYLSSYFIPLQSSPVAFCSDEVSEKSRQEGLHPFVILAQSLHCVLHIYRL